MHAGFRRDLAAYSLVLALTYVKGRPRKEKSPHVLFVCLALYPQLQVAKVRTVSHIFVSLVAEV